MISIAKKYAARLSDIDRIDMALRFICMIAMFYMRLVGRNYPMDFVSVPNCYSVCNEGESQKFALKLKYSIVSSAKVNLRFVGKTSKIYVIVFFHFQLCQYI